MKAKNIHEYIRCLEERALPDGGFATQPSAAYRPDATAWGVLAMAAAGSCPDIVSSSRKRLVADQLGDGSVTIARDHPEAFWPTPLAVLAWQGSAPHRNARAMALAFLINTTGVHGHRESNNPVANDPSLRGWPWIAQTHSWVEPTSLAVIALKSAGYGGHTRVLEGVRMLLDRQLPHGGWNMGNTAVYGQELRPFPDYTGVALTALAGHVSKEHIQKSITYLKASLITLRSPLSLGWGLLGLGAWGKRPRQARSWIRESLELQASYGPYETSLLSLLLLAFLTDGGLTDIIAAKET